MTKTIASVSLTSLIGMTLAAAATDENGSLLLGFADGTSALLEADHELEGSLTLKKVDGDLSALVGGTLDMLMAEFDDVNGRPDMVGVDGVITLLIGADNNAEVTLTWHGAEAGDDILSERSLTAHTIDGEIAMAGGETAEKKVPTIAPETAALGDALAAALASQKAPETAEVETPAPVDAPVDESADAEPALGDALDAAIEAQAPSSDYLEGTVDEASAEETPEETAEDTAEDTAEAVSEETATTEWTYPVGTEHPVIMVYPTDTFPKEVFTNSRKKWTPEAEELLGRMFKDGASMHDLVHEFGRTPVALIVRLAEMNLVVKDHPYAERLAASKAAREKAQAEKAAAKEEANQPVAA